MKSEQDPNPSVIGMIISAGVLSSLVVTFAIYLYYQRRQADPFFASNDFRVFQERQAISNIRRGIAEDFLSAVINCASPPILPSQVLTEEQVSDRVTRAIESISSLNGTMENPKCQNSRSSRWTFELPCTLKMSESFSKISGGLNFGELGICKPALVKSILSATHSCADSADFPACLARTILTYDVIKNELDKPVEIQHFNNK
jgi:hypothetical protein